MGQDDRKSGGIDRFINQIPGLGDYREQERRADAQRQAGANLASTLQTHLERLERIGNDLATERRMSEISAVERTINNLRYGIDRLKVHPVDPGNVSPELSGAMAAIEHDVAEIETEARSHAGTGESVRRLEQGIATLLMQINQAVQTQPGQKAQPSPLSVLQDQASTPRSQPLETGDAVSVRQENYLVDAVIAITASEYRFQLLRLGQTPERWLVQPETGQIEPAILSPIEEAVPVGDALQISDTRYQRVWQASGEGEVTGAAGSSGKHHLTAAWYTADLAVPTRLLVIDWGNERQLLAGPTVDATDIDIFPRKRH